jgi:hypothetical protein
MPALIFLAILVVVGVIFWRATRNSTTRNSTTRGGHGGSHNDAPARIVAAASARLPEGQGDWGRAMAAELTQVQGRGRRWRFAAGVLRVVVFPPPRYPGRVLVVAAVGLAVAVAATVLATREVPTIAVFTAVFGLLLAVGATVVAARAAWNRPGVARVAVGMVAAAGIAGTVVSAVRVAWLHPSATADGTHVYSVAFAVVLTGYLAIALARPRLGDRTDTVLWWALAGALVTAACWIVEAVVAPVPADGVEPFAPLASVVATLLVSAGAAARTGTLATGARAGLLGVILAGPVRFTIDLTTLLRQHTYTLTNAYDLAKYPHSGFPDVASYLISDALGGEIISNLVLLPIALLVVALLGAAAGSSLRRGSAGTATLAN